jgi:hypothetical protein
VRQTRGASNNPILEDRAPLLTNQPYSTCGPETCLAMVLMRRSRVSAPVSAPAAPGGFPPRLRPSAAPCCAPPRLSAAITSEECRRLRARWLGGWGWRLVGGWRLKGGEVPPAACARAVGVEGWRGGQSGGGRFARGARARGVQGARGKVGVVRLEAGRRSAPSNPRDPLAPRLVPPLPRPPDPSATSPSRLLPASGPLHP